jgi:hypothetical protein
MSESQASTHRERQCMETDQQCNPCPELQILRPDAEQPFTRVGRGKNSPYLTPVKRLGWICSNGHFDEPTPDEVLREGCRALLRFHRETSVLLGLPDPLPEVFRSQAEPLDVPAPCDPAP